MAQGGHFGECIEGDAIGAAQPGLPRFIEDRAGSACAALVDEVVSEDEGVAIVALLAGGWMTHWRDCARGLLLRGLICRKDLECQLV